jgi:hypothetical protein
MVKPVEAKKPHPREDVMKPANDISENLEAARVKEAIEFGGKNVLRQPEPQQLISANKNMDKEKARANDKSNVVSIKPDALKHAKESLKSVEHGEKSNSVLNNITKGIEKGDKGPQR